MILNEVMKLRSQCQSLKKAKAHAHDMLPTEPQSLVAKYLTGKERPSKEQWKCCVTANVTVDQQSV